MTTIQVLDFPLLVNDGGASLKSDLGVRTSTVCAITVTEEYHHRSAKDAQGLLGIFEPVVCCIDMMVRSYMRADHEQASQAAAGARHEESDSGTGRRSWDATGSAVQAGKSQPALIVNDRGYRSGHARHCLRA